MQIDASIYTIIGSFCNTIFQICKC